MTIAIIGCGYVGLVSGACFATLGENVICVDTDKPKIRSLQEGRVPWREPGLDSMVQEGLRRGNLSFSTEISPAVRAADIVIISVGTPADPSDGHADLSHVFQVIVDMAEHLRD